VDERQDAKTPRRKTPRDRMSRKMNAEARRRRDAEKKKEEDFFS
jgi:hypothetical protein